MANKFNYRYEFGEPQIDKNEKFILLNWQAPIAVFNSWARMHEYINSNDFIKYNSPLNLSFKIIKEIL